MADNPPPPEELVPHDVIPCQTLPPLKWRELPEPISWKRMVGPSIMLAGLSLGSGEFILWPKIVYEAGFIFFWACMLGVFTQYFLNMEIERYTLATGESTITGFCRLSRHWAWVMLILNILPWAWPAWATGAGKLLCWIVDPPAEVDGVVVYDSPWIPWVGIAGLVLVGVVLTAGPVVYKTVEKIQTVLVGLIMVLVILISVLVVRWDAVEAMGAGIASLGSMPDLADSNLTFMMLLGAIAFAGAGGTTNLGQSNFIKDKGYGMGHFIGRITSPITGQQEAIPGTGYLFRSTESNLRRWKGWWRGANIEHVLSFLVTCVVCLCLMSLITYSLFYGPDGERSLTAQKFSKDIDFVWGQAEILGGGMKFVFLVLGIAVLLTTELGVLDATARFLWGEIGLGSAILLAGVFVPQFAKPEFLIVTTAAMNGVVMFIYSLLLLYLNMKILPRPLSMTPLRFLAIIWSAAFFGYFSIQALRYAVLPFVFGIEPPS